MGCRRTAAQEKHPGCTTIVCAICWRLAPKHFRLRVRRIERIARKIGFDLWGCTSWPKPFTPERRLLYLHNQAFKRLIAAATEVKVGIRALTPGPARRKKRPMLTTRTRRT